MDVVVSSPATQYSPSGILAGIMRIWGLSDTHLSFANPKPMDVFGDHWRDHPAKIARACHAVIEPEDLLLMPGDLSWAMKRVDAEADLAWIGPRVDCIAAWDQGARERKHD